MMNKKIFSSKKFIFFSVFTVILIAVVIWIVIGNISVEVNKYRICSERVPKSFSGFRIAQISDLHNAEFGRDNKSLLQKLKDSDPDIIVITGDLIDSRNTRIDVALSFVKEALEIAPVYYVSGNHEARIDEFHRLIDGLISAGVTFLDNEAVTIEVGGEKIFLAGINDPAFFENYDTDFSQSMLKEFTDSIDFDEECFSILLTHRPEGLDIYADRGFDLVFSGHVHGGQIRLPFVGGLFGPNQGFFPKYDSGVFTYGKTQMVVSRGLGNSLFPFRVNNMPEIVIADLVSE